MSEKSEEMLPGEIPNLPPAPVSPGTAQYIARVVAWTFGIIGIVLVVLVTSLAIYSTTADFQRRMTTQLANVLEDATGGRVEVSHIGLDVWHLSAEVDGLIIHGLEAPTDAPYLSAERILVRIKVLSFLGHATGTASVSRISLDFLRVESPRAHIIVDKDGKTNIPTPKKQNQSNEPIADTLLNLKAQKVEVVQGVALLNDQAIPFNLSARDLNAELHYLAATDRYTTTIDLNDLRTQINKQPEAKSKLHVEAEVGRDAATLKALDFHTGDHSDLHATAALKQFNNPAWQTTVTGSVELKQLTLLADVDGFSLGSVDLNLDGHSCGFAPPAAPTKKPKLLDRLRGKKGTSAASAASAAPVEPDCQAGYLLTGGFKLHAGAYRNIYVRFHDINGGGQFHITPRQLLLTNFVGTFPGGGAIKGDMRMEDWLDKARPVTATGKPLSGPPIGSGRTFVEARFEQLPLRTILDDSAPIDFGDLGFDTAATGPVKVTWGGPVPAVSDTVQVEADFQMAPTGNHRATAISDVPVNGQLVAHYDGLTETVQVHHLNFNTPHSNLSAVGLLGVNVGDPLTVLNVDLQIRDLAEYDQLFRTIALTGNNRLGAAAIPMNLYGAANFHGVTRGPIARLDWKGHLDAENLEIRLGDILKDPPPKLTTALPPPASTDVHIDTVVADLEYNPAFVALASSTLTRGTAVMHISGNFKPRPVVLNHVPDFLWDTGTGLDAQIQLGNSSLTDLLTIAGQQNNIPVTGTVAMDAHVTGTFANPNGSATIALANGVAYGEPYESVNVTGAALDQNIEATNIAVRLHGMAINGTGGYNLHSKHLHGHIQGDNLRLSKFAVFQQQGINADGMLSLVADANGTAEQPGLKASL